LAGNCSLTKYINDDSGPHNITWGPVSELSPSVSQQHS
jgi:hypothetical protein